MKKEGIFWNQNQSTIQKNFFQRFINYRNEKNTNINE